MFATAAAGNYPSVGSADVGSVSVRNVWKKIFGACPAMASPGNARIVAARMASATSEGPMRCGKQKDKDFFNYPANYGW
jgi:hypothetical protein